MLKLSKRLAAIAAFVPDGARVVDVGTDHGYIPVWLAQNGFSARISASDIHPDPLQRAVALANETQTIDKIHFSVCDGLSDYSNEDCDCVVIAGMGGEMMVHILSDVPWTKKQVTLILQPQTKGHILRAWLRENGYTIQKESLVKDMGRIYPILLVQGGRTQDFDTAELYLGKYELIAGDPLLREYIDRWVSRLSKEADYNPESADLMQEMLQWKERI